MNPPPPPQQLYLDTMRLIRERFDLIDSYTRKNRMSFLGAETIAFNTRKIIEAISYGCLISLENSLGFVPRDIKGQWNAEAILKRLKTKGIDALPIPCWARTATREEQETTNANHFVSNVPEHELSYDELVTIYQYMHGWAHELNPYVEANRFKYLSENYKILIDNVVKISNFISNHYILIKGKGFYSVLKDENDGLSKLILLNSQKRDN